LSGVSRDCHCHTYLVLYCILDPIQKSNPELNETRVHPTTYFVQCTQRKYLQTGRRGTVSSSQPGVPTIIIIIITLFSSLYYLPSKSVNQECPQLFSPRAIPEGRVYLIFLIVYVVVNREVKTFLPSFL
jgi:hypothetical protein